MNSKLKVGVLGIGRGSSFAYLFEKYPDTKLEAICDFDKVKVAEFLKGRKDIEVYQDYDKFLEHELDIVILCNYATEHAPYAIKALQSNRHVLSEVTACKTLAEGVALCRAVEESGKIYMYAENYCYFDYTQEMQRLYKKGLIGEYRYGECEYVHDCRSVWHRLTTNPQHWRNWSPSTYYCTHSLGPIITITNTRPVKVSGFVVPNTLARQVGRVGDDWGLLICTMDNDAVTRVIPWSTGPHNSIWFRLHGTRGAMENNRWKDTDILNLYFEQEKGKFKEESYRPKFQKDSEETKKYGHGGSDFFIPWEFIEAILKNKKTAIDVYMAMDMTLPGILGYRSALGGNVSLEVPDFRKEKIRKQYENDNWSPDPKDEHLPGQPSPSILGKIKIPHSVYRMLEEARKAKKTTLEEAYKID